MKTLYKYCPERISFFENPMLRFTPPLELNDVFDCFPSISGMFPAGKTWEEIEPQIINSIQNRPHAEVRYITACSRSLFKNRNIPKVAEQINNADLKLIEEARNILNLSYEQNPFGILCLSEIPDSILMWSYYSDSHRGYIIELDIENNFFNQKTLQHDELNYVRKVQYVTERPTMAVMELVNNPTQILYTKSKIWEHEQEWRMIWGGIDSIPLVDNKKGLIQIDREVICSIILGVNASKKMIGAAQKFCKENCIPLKKMVSDPQKYQLTMVGL